MFEDKCLEQALAVDMAELHRAGSRKASHVRTARELATPADSWQEAYERTVEMAYRLGWSAKGIHDAKADAVTANSGAPDLAVAMAALADTLAGRDELLADTLAQIAMTPKKITRDYQGNITGIEPG